MAAMATLRTSVHPNAIILVIVGLVTAIAIGVRNSSWLAGFGFALAALVFVLIVNHILVTRETSRGSGAGKF